MSVSNNFLRLGVLSALIGMSLGVWMGANQDFVLRPVHAHINLIGFASMMLFGLFYRSFPAAAQGWLPKVHFALSVLGFLILMPCLSLMLLGKPVFMPAMIASEIMLVTSMLLFVVIVFMATMKKGEPSAA
jgi:peptidoglycan/LPS O-acetylase OafA/YrhL